jgi:hypothetical protein
VVISLGPDRTLAATSVDDADAFAGLCRRLVDASALPTSSSRRAYLAAALAATLMDMAVIADGSPDGPQWVGALATRVSGHDAAGGPLREGHRLPGPDWPAALGARTVLRRTVTPAGPDRDVPASEIVLLSFTDRDLDETDQLVIDVVARFAALASPRGEHVTGSQARLREHVASALRTRDLTGNGISVARGWLDHLATGDLDAETRDLGLDTAQRRLADVQTAVDTFIHATTHALMTGSSSGRADLLRAWQSATGTSLTTVPPLAGPTAALEIVAHSTGLESFLRAAAPLLVPEAALLPDRVRIPLTDAGRLDDEARAYLGASQGELALDRDGAGVDWRRVREPDASTTRPAGRRIHQN